jgi:hypothetical protein
VHSPTAHITVNRNRVKNYDEKVYLKDNTHFEIELFNPLKVKALVSISIDGKDISDRGIILSPGQRVYLERWIDTPKKFKFSTYSVENSEEAKEAISENGRVVVAFHEEVVKNFYPNGLWNGSIVTSGSQPYQYVTDYVYRGSSSPLPPLGGTTTNNLTYYSNASSYTISGNLSSANLTSSNASVAGSLSIETGRAEKGENSSQTFREEIADFNTYAAKIVEWKILPESLKPIEISKIRSYCTDCGTRVRATSWKFCPSCGEKL